RLAAGAGTHVEPALPRSRLGDTTQRERGELRTLVLHARSAVGDGGDACRIAAGARHSEGRMVPGFSAQLLRLRESGQGREAHGWGGVVSLKKALQLVLPPLGGECPAQGADDP